MWDLSGLGMEPLSLALAGRLLTTGPPEKSPSSLLEVTRLWVSWGLADHGWFLCRVGWGEWYTSCLGLTGVSQMLLHLAHSFFEISEAREGVHFSWWCWEREKGNKQEYTRSLEGLELFCFLPHSGQSILGQSTSHGQTQVQGRNKYEQGKEKVPLVQPTTESTRNTRKRWIRRGRSCRSESF